MASKKSNKAWDEPKEQDPIVEEAPEVEPAKKQASLSARAKAWVDQAIAKFGDTDITAGEDFLQSDFTKIDDLPSELQGYWGRPGQDLTGAGYQKADPQPDHEMTARGMILWITRKDMYEARMTRQQEFSQTRMKAAGDTKISGPTPSGAGGEIKGVAKEDGDWR